MSAVARLGAALTLTCGRPCRLTRPRLPGLRDYYVLAVEARAADRPGDDDGVGAIGGDVVEELSRLAHRIGRDLATDRHGDPECYSLIYNGRRTRRAPWPHVHIVVAASTAAKRRAFVALQLKHLLRWRRWWLVRRLLGPAVGR